MIRVDDNRICFIDCGQEGCICKTREQSKNFKSQPLTPDECYQICPKCNKKSLRKYGDNAEICGYCMTYSYSLKEIKK